MHRDKNIQYYDDDTISIYEIWLIMRKRIWLIFIITLLSFGFSLTYFLLAPGVYKVSNVMVLSQSLSIANQVLQGRSDHSKDFINILEIKSSIVALKDLSKKQKAKALGLDKSVIEAIEDIKISQIEGANSLKAEVDTLDRDSGVKMIKAISNFTNDLPFVQRRVKSAKELLEKNRDDLRDIIENPLSLLNLPDNAMVSEILSSLY